MIPKTHKLEKREARREAKALTAARLEKTLEKELVARLKSRAYGDAPLNVNESVWQAVLNGDKAAAARAEKEVEGQGQEDELEMEDDDSAMEDDEEEEEEEGEFEREFVEDFEESDEEDLEDLDERFLDGPSDMEDDEEDEAPAKGKRKASSRQSGPAKKQKRESVCKLDKARSNVSSQHRNESRSSTRWKDRCSRRALLGDICVQCILLSIHPSTSFHLYDEQ